MDRWQYNTASIELQENKKNPAKGEKAPRERGGRKSCITIFIPLNIPLMLPRSQTSHLTKSWILELVTLGLVLFLFPCLCNSLGVRSVSPTEFALSDSLTCPCPAHLQLLHHPLTCCSPQQDS